MSYTINTRTQFGQPLVTYSGIASGVNTQALVDADTAAASQNQTLLNARAIQQASKAGYYASIATQLGNLDRLVGGLQYAGLFAPSFGTTSDASTIAINTSTTAQTGTYQVNVSQLAAAQRNLSTAVASGNATVISDAPPATITNPAPVAPLFGSVKIAVGAGPTTTFNLDRTTTLNGLVNSINQSGLAVTASVVTDSNGARLNLVSKNTGTASALTITETNSKLRLTDGLQQAAKDAQGTVNGAAFSVQNNQPNGLIMGLTMSFSALTGGPVTISVYKDATNLNDTVQAFVINYNAARSAINAATAYSQVTVDNSLLGDGSVQNATNALSRAITSKPITTTGLYRTLAEIGVSQKADGTLAIDSDALSSAIAADASSVANLFSDTPSGKGISSQVDALTTLYGGPAGVFMKMSLSTSANASDNAEAAQDMQYAIDAQASTMQSNFVIYELNMSALAAQNMLVESFANSINAANAAGNQTPVSLATGSDGGASEEAAAAKALAASLTTGGGLNGFVPQVSKSSG